MGETSYQIERHIRETRNDLGDNLSELENKVKTAMDWRAQFEERPMTMIALAFGGGVLLSALLPSPRPSQRRYADNCWAASPDRDSVSPVRPSFEPAGKPNQTLETVNALKNALVGAAVAKAGGFLEDLLPGFKQEFTKTETGKRLEKHLDQPTTSASTQPTRQKANAAGAD
jgi:hypothetical protein